MMMIIVTIIMVMMMMIMMIIIIIIIIIMMKITIKNEKLMKTTDEEGYKYLGILEYDKVKENKIKTELQNIKENIMLENIKGG